MIYQRNQFTDSSFIIRLRCLWVLLLFATKQCCKNHSNAAVWNWCTTNMRTPYHLTWQGKHLLVPNLQSGMCQGFQIWKEWRATSDNLAGKTFLWQRRDGRLPSCAHAQQKKTCHGPTHAAHVLGKNTVPSVTSWLGLIYQTDRQSASTWKTFHNSHGDENEQLWVVWKSWHWMTPLFTISTGVSRTV